MGQWITRAEFGWWALSWWSQEGRLFKARARPKEVSDWSWEQRLRRTGYEGDVHHSVASGSDSNPRDNKEPLDTRPDWTPKSAEPEYTLWCGKILLQSSRSCTTHEETFGHISPRSPQAGVLSRRSVCQFCPARPPKEIGEQNPPQYLEVVLTV